MSKTKTAPKTVKLTTSKEEKETKIKVDQAAIEKLEEEIQNIRKEQETKVYIITKDKTIGNALDNFIRNESRWKYTEVLGVMELGKQISKFVDNDEKSLVLDATAVQALYYFVGKVEGTGLDSAISYYNTVLKPVSDAATRVDSDKKNLEMLEFRKVSLEQGIDPDNPGAYMGNGEMGK